MVPAANRRPQPSTQMVPDGRAGARAEALEKGLLAETCPAEQLDERARELAMEIATNTSPVALALTRRLLWRFSTDADPSGALAVDAPLNIALGKGADVHEGVSAFLEKRAPNFPSKVSSDMPATPWWPADPTARRQG